MFLMWERPNHVYKNVLDDTSGCKTIVRRVSNGEQLPRATRAYNHLEIRDDLELARLSLQACQLHFT